jgi:hypothetical protein
MSFLHSRKIDFESKQPRRKIVGERSFARRTQADGGPKRTKTCGSWKRTGRVSRPLAIGNRKKLWPAEVKTSPAISLGPRALEVECKVLKDDESNLAPMDSWGASFFLLPSSFEDGSTEPESGKLDRHRSLDRLQRLQRRRSLPNHTATALL